MDEASAIFLNNKLLKDRRTLDHIGNELSRDSARMKELEQAVSSIAEKGSAEYDDARDVSCDSVKRLKIVRERRDNHSYLFLAFTRYLPQDCFVINRESSREKRCRYDHSEYWR